jgi:hypothetical protein
LWQITGSDDITDNNELITAAKFTVAYAGFTSPSFGVSIETTIWTDPEIADVEKFKPLAAGCQPQGLCGNTNVIATYFLIRL